MKKFLTTLLLLLFVSSMAFAQTDKAAKEKKTDLTAKVPTRSRRTACSSA